GAFRHADGRQIAVRRRKGTKNTLVDHADQPLSDDALEPYLAGITRDIFAREFGLTAQALRSGGTELLNAGGSLAETLAASSAGLTVLSRVRDRVRSEADELFTPRKSASKPFYLAAERHDLAEKALRDAVVTREALADAEKAVAEARTLLEQLNADHAASGLDLARWQRTLRVRSRLLRLDNLAAELAALADLPPVSAASLDEWRGALAADADHARELSSLDAADAADAEAIAGLSVDEAVLSAGPTVDALRERLGAVRKAMDDLPRRREARRLAQEQLDAAARRLGLASHLELIAALPTDPALAHVRDLIDRARRAEQAKRDADDKRARVLQEIDTLAADDGASHAISDPEAARQRLDALADIPTHADRLRRDAAALALETNNIVAAGAALDPPPGDIARLASLPLPDPQVIAAHARAAELAEAEVRRLDDVLAAAAAAIETAESELARLSSAGAVSTRADLLGARSQRNVQLTRLRDALDGERAERAARLGDVEAASREIDDITDRLLTDTDRAARREAAQERLDLHRRERDRVKATLEGLQGRRAEADAAWRAIWSASGLLPRSPAEMARWRERVDALVARMAKCDAQQADLDALAAGQESGRVAVIALLEQMGRTPDRTLPAEILYREARSRLDELQKAWSDARARAVARQRAERDLAEAQKALDVLAQAGAERAQDWPAAMAQIGQAERASVAEADAALAVWHSVAVPKLSLETEGHRVDSIEADLLAFDGDVAAVLTVAPDLQGSSAQESLARLADRLAETRRAADACHRLREAVAKRVTVRNSTAAKRAALDVTLHQACEALGVADSAALAVAIERVATRLALQNEQAQLHRDLLEVADGRDEAALRAEQQGLDIDALPGEIERESVRQKQLLDDIARTSAELHQKQRDYDALIQGRDATAAAAERAEAGVELVDIAERWLLRSAAARLALLAIEKHRAMVQDPLIARASELFALATGRVFAGLGVDYSDDDRPVLVAKRTDGERVAIAGLSEGSRDQLFLALRLALLERRTHQPLPFIGDDLLTSFDEARTAATLELLAAAGRERQMIVFTHHQHVAELARAVPGHAVEVVTL
ncbi:MAG: AAA family ATPase, partial [Tardiphaga sp.]